MSDAVILGKGGGCRSPYTTIDASLPACNHWTPLTYKFKLAYNRQPKRIDIDTKDPFADPPLGGALYYASVTCACILRTVTLKSIIYLGQTPTAYRKAGHEDNSSIKMQTQRGYTQ